MNADFLRLAAVVTFVVTGALLLIGGGIELRTGLALTCFALAALAASGSPRFTP